MTSLERAKALVHSAKKLALIIVPLATVAVTAQATAAFPQFSFGSGTCPAGTVSSATVSNPDSGGLKLFTASSCSEFVSGGGTLTLSANGSGTGGAFSVLSLPIHVIFTPTFDGGGNIDYAFTVDLNGSSNSPQLTGSVASGEVVDQGFDYTIPANSSLTNWAVSLALTVTGNGTLGLTVPQNSIDLNVDAVPEPATLLLVAPAVAFMFLRRRKL